VVERKDGLNKLTEETIMPRPGRNIPDIIELAWLKNQFEQLRRDHVIILDKLDKLAQTVPEFISPELQEQIIRAAKLSHRIDLKVPDR